MKAPQDIILKPVITERSIDMLPTGKYTFKVAKDANKVEIKKAVEKGICKLNIYSEMLSAYYGELKKKLDSSGTLAIWVVKANEKPLEALKEVVKEKIDLCGSAGKA